eukprot:TRINITY_DN1794_c0_g1_i6.p1 TRINITY_DN1794_c0_g1~~TRINITY_DN1794_c0_g1_i6.p1  ORF type:complete len:1406 (+),score=380.60 TRINITY_DN1794_c0_g1_i6:2105-6322(+)
MHVVVRQSDSFMPKRAMEQQDLNTNKRLSMSEKVDNNPQVDILLEQSDAEVTEVPIVTIDQPTTIEGVDEEVLPEVPTKYRPLEILSQQVLQKGEFWRIIADHFPIQEWTLEYHLAITGLYKVMERFGSHHFQHYVSMYNTSSCTVEQIGAYAWSDELLLRPATQARTAPPPPNPKVVASMSLGQVASFNRSRLGAKTTNASANKSTVSASKSTSTSTSTSKHVGIVAPLRTWTRTLVSTTNPIHERPSKPTSDQVSCKYEAKIGRSGLFNQGATCYLNGLLQSLFRLPAVIRIILKMVVQKEEHQNVALALQRLFYDMMNVDGPASTKALTRSFGWADADAYEQRDTTEMFTVMIDNLNEKNKGTVLENSLVDLFAIKTVSHIKCTDIGFSKDVAPETCRFLSLDVDGCPDMSSSLRKYFAVAHLNGKDQFDTGSAGYGLQDAEMRTLFQSLPPILNLDLKRYTFDFESMQMKKVSSQFDFPEELDLSEFLHPDADRSVPAHYKLHSVLAHVGGAGSGHYVAYARDPVDGWFMYNDSVVTKSKIECATENNFGGEETKEYRVQWSDGVVETKLEKTTKPYQAYRLVYVRVSDEALMLHPLTADDCPQYLHEFFVEKEQIAQLEKEVAAKPSEYTRLRVVTDLSAMAMAMGSGSLSEVAFAKEVAVKRGTSISEVKQIIMNRLHIRDQQQRDAQQFFLMPDALQTIMPVSGRLLKDADTPLRAVIGDHYKYCVFAPSAQVDPQSLLITMTVYEAESRILTLDHFALVSGETTQVLYDYCRTVLQGCEDRAIDVYMRTNKARLITPDEMLDPLGIGLHFVTQIRRDDLPRLSTFEQKAAFDLSSPIYLNLELVQTTQGQQGESKSLNISLQMDRSWGYDALKDECLRATTTHGHEFTEDSFDVMISARGVRSSVETTLGEAVDKQRELALQQIQAEIDEMQDEHVLHAAYMRKYMMYDEDCFSIPSGFFRKRFGGERIKMFMRSLKAENFVAALQLLHDSRLQKDLASNSSCKRELEVLHSTNPRIAEFLDEVRDGVLTKRAQQLYHESSKKSHAVVLYDPSVAGAGNATSCRAERCRQRALARNGLCSSPSLRKQRGFASGDSLADSADDGDEGYGSDEVFLHGRPSWHRRGFGRCDGLDRWDRYGQYDGLDPGYDVYAQYAGSGRYDQSGGWGDENQQYAEGQDHWFQEQVKQARSMLLRRASAMIHFQLICVLREGVQAAMSVNWRENPTALFTKVKVVPTEPGIAGIRAALEATQSCKVRLMQMSSSSMKHVELALLADDASLSSTAVMFAEAVPADQMDECNLISVGQMYAPGGYDRFCGDALFLVHYNFATAGEFKERMRAYLDIPASEALGVMLRTAAACYTTKKDEEEVKLANGDRLYIVRPAKPRTAERCNDIKIYN